MYCKAFSFLYFDQIPQIQSILYDYKELQGQRPNTSLISEMCHTMFDELESGVDTQKKSWNSQCVISLVHLDLSCFFNHIFKLIFQNFLLKFTFKSQIKKK